MGNRKITEIPPAKIPLLTPAKLKACAYVRVSTEHTGQINSLKNQTEYYERLLAKNPSYEYCGIFSDAGISGNKQERPGFLAMMEKARAGKLDLIITKSISRFARNTVMLLKYVRELKAAGVAVIFEEQKINTLSSKGELMLTVLGAIAEEERKTVCLNISWATRNSFKRGEVMVDTNRLIGYDKDKHGNLIINEEQAKIVKEIYKRYLAGDPGYKIANDLNETGVPTYTEKPWSSHRIIRIIANEKYKGDCLLQKSFVAETGKQTKNTGQLEKYYVYKNHQPIVSDQDWEAAQTIREGRKKKAYPFTRLLICPYCGAFLIRVVHEGRWVSWICSSYLRKGKSACTGMRISQAKLDEITKDVPIKEPVVLEEVQNGQSRKKRSEKNYRLIPAAEYSDQKR